ncbi:hypothetical protein TPHA_0K00180 [Tetrapisispora phaffii CBS 4417]|uniref:Uncharacterized protein n=1 Tax=Tetrapisispora phaffii (strain ATCC 24235 / CBS 4417 / NBRC 1672 / NRRL Y-8282 / UCD 70-5) TaxID=1071381 RepID=G8BZ24_TETPH|nr:hypothetical protein TPHA_0K00180 [Tetrapisispora phaffii CBS 4417]CCE65152.1 hypothetical protein TPHA_0K00180 [Tetrapisispora phaffii CBS 4417]
MGKRGIVSLQQNNKVSALQSKETNVKRQKHDAYENAKVLTRSMYLDLDLRPNLGFSGQDDDNNMEHAWGRAVNSSNFLVFTDGESNQKGNNSIMNLDEIPERTSTPVSSRMKEKMHIDSGNQDNETHIQIALRRISDILNKELDIHPVETELNNNTGTPFRYTNYSAFDSKSDNGDDDCDFKYCQHTSLNGGLNRKCHGEVRFIPTCQELDPMEDILEDEDNECTYFSSGCEGTYQGSN